MHKCSFCGASTLIAGTLTFFTGYRCEDRDYIIITDEDTGRPKGYLEILRYCPSCLLRHCFGEKAR